MNGREAKFATSIISNALFVGEMSGHIDTPEDNQCAVDGYCPGSRPNGDESTSLWYPSNHDAGNGWRHALHLPGIGSEVQVVNATIMNYQGAIYGCAWCVAHRGGYEMEFYNVSMENVEHIAHFKHGVGGIVIDGDGSLGVGVGGRIVPPTGQFRDNPLCNKVAGRYYECDTTVRRINLAINKWTSPWWDTNIKKHYPLVIVTDITDVDLTPEWDDWNREARETRVSCLSDDGCGRRHYGTPIGPEACFEQAPIKEYSFLASVGRRYLVNWVDQNYIRVTADVTISPYKMRPDEYMLLQFSQRPPLYPRLPVRAEVHASGPELWGELDPGFGAWSPPPKIPTYATQYQDHSGDGTLTPCASNAFVTWENADSCHAEAFMMPQLNNDPEMPRDFATKPWREWTNFVNGENGTFFTFPPDGMGVNGGMLHPFSGTVQSKRRQVSQNS